MRTTPTATSSIPSSNAGCTASRGLEHLHRSCKPGTKSCLLYSGGFAGQNTFRVVPTDGRAHNEARVKEETWKGDPVGHWEGDTLVIDTIGFTDESWLHKSGYFHSFKLHVVERLTRTGNALRLVTTVDIPTC